MPSCGVCPAMTCIKVIAACTHFARAVLPGVCTQQTVRSNDDYDDDGDGDVDDCDDDDHEEDADSMVLHAGIVIMDLSFFFFLTEVALVILIGGKTL